MLSDQQHYLLYLGLLKPKPPANAFSKFRPASNVAAALTFADVMKQKRQVQQCRIFKLFEDGAQVSSVPVLTGMQFVERFHCSQRILVDGKMVIEIVLH